MMNKSTGDDNWGQLLSEFGIEDQRQEEPVQEDAAQPEEPKAVRSQRISHPSKESPEPTHSSDFGAGLVEPTPESADELPNDELSKPREKKSIFSRFPKINFFGAPPEVSLDSVMEGVKSPSLGGKAFTDNKLEKMPVSQERTDRHKKHRREEEDASASPNAWSAVASQIDVLASSGETRGKRDGGKPEEETLGKRPARRNASSMFDDPIPESEEFRALKDLMGEQPSRKETRNDVFHDDETDSRQRGRGRRKPPPEETETRGRGSQYRSSVDVDDLSDSDFEPVEDERPAPRGRGRRGSRYAENNHRTREHIRDDAPQEEWSEIDAALQAGLNEPMQRGGRRPRYEKRRRPEHIEDSIDHEPLDNEESGMVAFHGDIPNWDDAVGDLIANNIARRKGHSHSGRGRR